MKTKFKASDFVLTQYSTAENKAKFANQFVKFVRGGFRMQDFSKWFYIRLSSTFGHIAHYNQLSFYEVFFTNPVDIRNFVRDCANYYVCGEPSYTYSDVEAALQQWMNSTSLVKEVEEAARIFLIDDNITKATAFLESLPEDERQNVLAKFM